MHVQSKANLDKKLESVIIYTLVFALSFLSFMYFGGPTASTGLDDSWTQALGYAWQHQLQMGRDFIFTYGPLSYLARPMASYHPELYPAYILTQASIAAVLSMLFIIRASQLTGRMNAAIFLFLIISIFAVLVPEPALMLTVVAVITMSIEPPHSINSKIKHFGFTALLLFIGVLIAFTKFPNFVLLFCGVLLLSVAFAVRYGLLSALAILMLYVALLIGIWQLAGQDLAYLLPFLHNSFSISKSYGEAMSAGLMLLELYLAAMIIGLSILAALCTLFKPRFNLNSFLIVLMVGLGLFLAFKAGFVRHDIHSLIFFTISLVITFYFNDAVIPNRFLRYSFHLLRYSIVLLALWGIFISTQVNQRHYNPANFLGTWNSKIHGNIHQLLHIQQVHQQKQVKFAALQQQYVLPKIKQIVDNAKVDIFSWEQGVLLLNEFNWHPRPIFQSYLAYNAHLNEINGQFYASDQAPDYVLFKLQAIDGQYPFMNDTEALKIVLRDYQPILEENGYLLLQRRPQGTGLVKADEVLLSKTLAFNEKVDLSSLNDESLLVSLSIEKSLLGHVFGLLYRMPPVYMDIQRDSGIPQRFRIIPSMVENEIVLNPLLVQQADVINWYAGSTALDLNSIRLTLPLEWLTMLYQPEIHLQVTRNPIPIPQPNLNKEIAQIVSNKYPMFNQVPNYISMPHSKEQVEGEAAMMVHPPGIVKFQLSAGQYRVTTEFGILAAAYAEGYAQPTDGAVFRIVMQHPSTETTEVLFEHSLNPLQTEADRGIQMTETLTFELATAATLQLETTAGSALNSASDWTFWRNVNIENIELVE